MRLDWSSPGAGLRTGVVSPSDRNAMMPPDPASIRSRDVTLDVPVVGVLRMMTRHGKSSHTLPEI